MKGHEIIRYAVRGNLPDRAQIREACKQQSETENPRTRRTHSRAVIAATTAAALALCFLFGGFLRNPKGENSFLMKAYAMELQADDSIALREVDLVDRPDIWGGYYDGGSGRLYLNVGLRCEGENIERVTFSVNEGFFAKQEIHDLKFDGDVPRLYAGAESRLAMIGTDFDVVGNEVTLERDAMTDDLLLFWGMEAEESEFADMLDATTIRIHAKATFRDHTSAEQTITIDLSRQVALMVSASEAKLEGERRDAARTEASRNLPLEEMEPVPESLRPLTLDPKYNALYFEFTIGGNDASVLVQADYMAFDDNGVARGAVVGDPSDPSRYLVVITRGGGGELTGMLYRLPDLAP